MERGSVHFRDVLSGAEPEELFPKFLGAPRVAAFLFLPEPGKVLEVRGRWEPSFVGSKYHEVGATGAWTALSHRDAGSTFVAKDLRNRRLYRAPELVLTCRYAVQEFRPELLADLGWEDEKICSYLAREFPWEES